MIKQLLNNILFKKQEASKPSIPAFKITENGPQKADFEVTELSYEEYAKFISQERRAARHHVDNERQNSLEALHA